MARIRLAGRGWEEESSYHMAHGFHRSHFIASVIAAVETAPVPAPASASAWATCGSKMPKARPATMRVSSFFAPSCGALASP